MGRLAIVTWLFGRQPKKWRQLKYGPFLPEHVNALRRACALNIRVPHRFVALADDPAGIEGEVWRAPPEIVLNGHEACYRRLKAFDAEFQASLEAEFVLQLDLDIAFAGDATALIEAAMARDFTILEGSRWERDGTLCSHYNGSIWLCRAGARTRFWSEFIADLGAAGRRREAFRMPNGKRAHGSDQAWLSALSQDEAVWTPETGVMQYRTLKGKPVPESVRILAFAGPDKPWGPEVMRERPEIAALWRRYAERGAA